MIRRTICTAAFLAAVSLPFLPSPAGAYVIQESGSGKELHFTVMPKAFEISQDGSQDIAGDGEFDAIRRAFATWADVPDAEARFTPIEVTSKDTTDIFRDAGLPARDQTNLLVWVEEGWIESPSQIAVTYTYFIDQSGKILEDDITMNGDDYTWTAGDVAVLTDTEEIAAHEIGHAFGMGHSLDSEATMFAAAGVGETKKRDLAQDDIDGIVHLYPAGCCKRNAGTDVVEFFGCHVGTGSQSPIAAMGMGLAAIAMVVARRGRRRRTHPPRRYRGRAAIEHAPPRGRGILGLLACAMLVVASPARASVARAYSVDELTTAAVVVVRGRVLSSDSSGSQFGAIVTLTQIEVEDVLKGDAPAVLTLVEPGGLASDGSGVGLHVSGAARFEPGEEVLVFAEPSRGAYASNFPGALRPVAMSQGKFSVLRESGAEPRVMRDLSGVARVTRSAIAEEDGSIQWAPVTFDDLEGLSLEQLSMIVRIHEIRLTPGCEGTLKIILAD